MNFSLKVKRELKQFGITTQETQLYCENPKVIEILKQKYSMKMICTKSSTGVIIGKKAEEGVDFLWPASSLAADQYKNKFGSMGGIVDIQPVLSSPIIAWTRKEAGEALIKHGMAEVRKDDSGVLDVTKFLERTKKKTQWKDIGINEFGPIKSRTTDIAKTSSGTAFLNIVAFLENNGATVTFENVEEVSKKVRPLMQNLGQMPMTTNDLMKECFMTGCYEVYFGLEGPFIRYSKESPSNNKAIEEKIAMFYIKPAAWGHHSLIALSQNAANLIKIITTDEDLQRIAWEDHGLRSGVLALKFDISQVGVKGLTADIGASITMPTAEVNDNLTKTVMKK